MKRIALFAAGTLVAAGASVLTASLTVAVPAGALPPPPGTFTSSGTITIPSYGHATPFPSTIDVAGLSGLTSNVTVDLTGFYHTFLADLVVEVVSPTGQALRLMSHNGGGGDLSNATVHFSDVGVPLPGTLVNGGTYQPSGGSGSGPPPTNISDLAGFIGHSPNGVWSLYVDDQAGWDQGSIASWTLHITQSCPDAVATGAADSYSGPSGADITIASPGVLLNDSLPTGFETTELASPPTHGSVAVGTDGGFSYSPASGFVGSDGFAYRIVGCDSETRSDPIQVALNVTQPGSVPPPSGPPNHPPVNTVPGDQTVDGGDTVPVPGVQVDDPDLTGDNSGRALKVTISADNGFVNAEDPPPPFFNDEARSAHFGGVLISHLPNGDLVLLGTQAGINVVLTTLTYTAPGDGSTVDVIRIHTDDLGNVGLGGPLADDDIIQVQVHVVPNVRVPDTKLSQTVIAVPGCKIRVTGVMMPSYRRVAHIVVRNSRGGVLQILDISPGLNNKFQTLTQALPCRSVLTVQTNVVANSNAGPAVTPRSPVTVHA